MKVEGIIGHDDALWNGSVAAPPDAPLMKYIAYYGDSIRELNKALAIDPRIEICQLPSVMALPCAAASSNHFPNNKMTKMA